MLGRKSEMGKNYLLFDKAALLTLVSRSVLQSVEYTQGMHLVNHFCARGSTEVFEDVAVKYYEDGIIFSGKKSQLSSSQDHNIFCVDLTQCKVMDDKEDMAAMLTIFQKIFRTALRIWNRQPFISSERIHGSRSIVFPFTQPDHRRIVIERAITIPRLTKRNIVQPLLAYKYSAEDPRGEDDVSMDVIGKAGEQYAQDFSILQRMFEQKGHTARDNVENSTALLQVYGEEQVSNASFSYLDFETQYSKLTETQLSVVDFPSLNSPLRINGAAGTGKTLALIIRAYKILEKFKRESTPFRIVFFTHSESSYQQCLEIFSRYSDGELFLDETNPQSIHFTSLISYCKRFAQIQDTVVLERDAGDAKTYQLMIIENIIENAFKNHTISTYKPLLSPKFKQLFDLENTPMNTLCALLQHEFSVQIKGRTDCSIEKYLDLPSIVNGLPCETKMDKEFVFTLFNEYQNELNSMNNYDVDDVTLEALSRLNAPVWRRERKELGFDYIFVDEMHLFNINEQSVFHFLTKDSTKETIPICFALDYSQAIGDRGDVSYDYIESAFGSAQEKKFQTVFRNSPQIADFCAAIAASGTLMFRENFENPYKNTQNNFTEQEERKCGKPTLHMYRNDDEMLKSIIAHVDDSVRQLGCKKNEVAVISFVPELASEEGAEELSKESGRSFYFVDAMRSNDSCFPIFSPYSVNGLEFQAVIMVGVDEGRVPQTAGTSDISDHFIRYSSYNLLYLTASRAKYKLTILGSKVNGKSTCVEHALQAEYLDIIDH